MSGDSKRPPPEGGDAGEEAGALAALARRIEELSGDVADKTQRLLEGAGDSVEQNLEAILEAAKRSSELARELVNLARKRHGSSADPLGVAAMLSPAPPTVSRPARESVPVYSQKRLRAEFREGRFEVVLLVEDEPMLLKTMRRMLEQYGNRVLAAATGAEALELASREASIQLLVTDLTLPGMTGNELVQVLRATRPTLRVLYTSGWDPASSGVTLAEDGSEAFLSKPFTSSDLDDRLRELAGTLPAALVQRV